MFASRIGKPKAFVEGRIHQSQPVVCVRTFASNASGDIALVRFVAGVACVAEVQDASEEQRGVNRSDALDQRESMRLPFRCAVGRASLLVRLRSVS